MPIDGDAAPTQLEASCRFALHRFVHDGIAAVMDSVLWPTIDMATDRGTPARSKVRTADRRMS